VCAFRRRQGFFLRGKKRREYAKSGGNEKEKDKTFRHKRLLEGIRLFYQEYSILDAESQMNTIVFSEDSCLQ
jgi:hypothetical protein